MSVERDSQLIANAEPAPVAAARAREPVPTNAATPEQIDLVCALRLLAEAIPTVLPKVITGEMRASGWSELSDILYRAARLCREQVIIDLDLDCD
jgi:hypothetical protein